MTPPTAPDTGAIRQRLEKITPGTWEWSMGLTWHVHLPCSSLNIPSKCSIAGHVSNEANANFIAHAPADIAALLALVERLEERHQADPDKEDELRQLRGDFNDVNAERERWKKEAETSRAVGFKAGLGAAASKARELDDCSGQYIADRIEEITP